MHDAEISILTAVRDHCLSNLKELHHCISPQVQFRKSAIFSDTKKANPKIGFSHNLRLTLCVINLIKSRAIYEMRLLRFGPAAKHFINGKGL